MWIGKVSSAPNAANEFGEVIQGKWWTKMPAAHWNEQGTWPQNACMSNDAFGTQGVVEATASDTVAYSLYLNADHSGLYRFELTCGKDVSNQKFFDSPITPWKALHKDKELAQGQSLPESRVVGSTRAETDAYFQKTICSAAGCTYRMNRQTNGPDSDYCKANRADCYTEGTFTIPSDFNCQGEAVLRWWWNSAEGLETYSNCMDMTFSGASITAAPSSANGDNTPYSNAPTGSADDTVVETGPDDKTNITGTAMAAVAGGAVTALVLGSMLAAFKRGKKSVGSPNRLEPYHGP